MAVAKELTDSDAVSVVVGQGPHVVQPIERVNGKFVVFSEGNLVSTRGPGQRPAGGDPGRDRRRAPLQGARRAGEGEEGHLRPDLGQDRRLRGAAGEGIGGPGERRGAEESYARTVDVVGEGNGFGPEF